MHDSIAATARKRFGSALLAAALQVVLVLVLIRGLAAPFVRLGVQSALTSLDLRTPPSPPPPPPRPVARLRPAAPTAPPAPRAQAAPFAAPPLPALKPPPVPAAAAPGQGAAASAGAAAAGNNSGAGGIGTGTGSGGDGDGDGGGTGAELASARIKPSDTPADIRNSPYKITTRSLVLIDATGAVRGCRAMGSSGNAGLDLLACRLIRERFRFRAARDRAGQAVVGQIIYEHDWEEGGGGGVNNDPPD